jgi:hypothetical protein
MPDQLRSGERRLSAMGQLATQTPRRRRHLSKHCRRVRSLRYRNRFSMTMGMGCGGIGEGNCRPRGSPMNRLLVALGAVLVVAGLLWPWLKRMHLFHLPGDIVIDRPGFKFFFPITTMLIVSAVVSLIAWLMRR